MTRGLERREESNRFRSAGLLRKPLRRSEAVENLEKVFSRSGDRDLNAAHISFLSDVADKTYELEPILQSVFAQTGSKWGLTIIVCFGAGPHRFSTLLKILAPISKRVLTLNLRNLERDGFISRTCKEENTLQVQYQLTPLGRELFELFWGVIAWTIEKADAIKAAQSQFDARQP